MARANCCLRPFADIVTPSDVAYRPTVSDGLDSMSEAPRSGSIELSWADLAALQRCWEQVYLEVCGIPNPPDQYTAPDALMTINGNRFSVCRTTGEVMLEGVFELNATTSPKSITWIDAFGPDAGKRLPASYQLERDSFMFIAADEGAPRPLVFRTGPGLTMRAFVRRFAR